MHTKSRKGRTNFGIVQKNYPTNKHIHRLSTETESVRIPPPHYLF